MDDLSIQDEKKPFDAELPQDDDTQPDPDEELMLDKGNGRVWLVKVPKHLMERWSSIDAEDVHLATIRVYNDAVGFTGKPPRIVLFLPSDPNDPTPRDPSLPQFLPGAAFTAAGEGGVQVDRYELDMVNEDVDNQMVVAERPKELVAPPSNPVSTSSTLPVNTRARTTILTGRVKHDCNLRPMFNESYRRQMRERSKKYNTPKRQIRMIEEAGVSGGRGGINRLSSGVAVGAGSAFSNLIQNKPKFAKGTFERMARMPRNQLLDLLFQLFREQPRWTLKALREKSQQPEVYLKEVLGEIALLNRSGEYNGMWELSEIFARDVAKAEGSSGSFSLANVPEVKMENYDDDEDDEDDDDEDEDMEEVS